MLPLPPRLPMPMRCQVAVTPPKASLYQQSSCRPAPMSLFRNEHLSDISMACRNTNGRRRKTLKKTKKLLVSLGLDNAGKHVFGKNDKENALCSKSKGKVRKAPKSNVGKRTLRSTEKRRSDR